MCANRFLVHTDVFDDFVTRLVAKVSALKLGDGKVEGVQIGPLISNAAVTRIQSLVEGAVQAGATVVTGGSRLAAESSFFRPTVLTGVSPEMGVCGDEVLGPIASVFRAGSKLTRNTKAYKVL